MWFGCDVGKSEERQLGLLDANLYDFKSTFGTGFGMNKRERLLYGESLMTHAMVFTGYDKNDAAQTDNDTTANDDKDETKVDKKTDKNAVVTDGTSSIRAWRVENSWGTSRGDNGYLCMTNDWFGEYVYQVVVHKDILDDKIADVLNQEAVTLPVWDPMGA